MRKVIFGGASSLDSYFARPNDAVDWLMWSDEIGAAIAEDWSAYDTILMGRRTCEVSLRESKGKAPYGAKRTFVFSRTLDRDPCDGVSLVRQEAAGFVHALKEEAGKDICVMGGGNLARTLFEADLIDEVGLNIHPVLLGAGIPVFHAMGRQIDLELMNCRPFANGCVLIRYRVRRETLE